MKRKNLNLILLMFVVVLSTLVNSCKEADKLKIDPQSGKDYVTAESAFSNVFNNVNDAVQANDLNKNSKNGCSVITIAGDYPAKSVTIDFGTTGCDNNGITYKGKIIAVMSGPFKTTGTTIDVSFDSFYINGNKIEGTKTISNLGRNADTKLMFKVEVKNGVIITSNGTIKFVATKNWTWLMGEETPWPAINDDVWQLEGNASGTNIDNLNYTVSTVTPLKINILGCDGKTEIVSGKLSIKPQEGQDMTLNYGNGLCDEKAVLNIAGIDYDINL